MSRLSLALALAAGCGPAAPAASEPAPARESAECTAARTEILAAMAASRDAAACATAAECAVVTGPGHPDPEYSEVVAARDAERLEADAVAHLERCGAFHHHEAIAAFRAIEAGCEAGRCVAVETVFHVEE